MRTRSLKRSLYRIILAKLFKPTDIFLDDLSVRPRIVFEKSLRQFGKAVFVTVLINGGKVAVFFYFRFCSWIWTSTRIDSSRFSLYLNLRDVAIGDDLLEVSEKVSDDLRNDGDALRLARRLVMAVVTIELVGIVTKPWMMNDKIIVIKAIVRMWRWIMRHSIRR